MPEHHRSTDIPESKFLGLIDKQYFRVAAIVGIVVSIYGTVVLPLQKLQIQVTQIQVELADFKTNIAANSAKNQEQDRRLDKLDTLLEQLSKLK